MSRWAVVEDGAVTNIVMWDGNLDSWQPPEGATMEPYDQDTHEPLRVHDPAPAGVQVDREHLVALLQELGVIVDGT